MTTCRPDVRQNPCFKLTDFPTRLVDRRIITENNHGRCLCNLFFLHIKKCRVTKFVEPYFRLKLIISTLNKNSRAQKLLLFLKLVRLKTFILLT